MGLGRLRARCDDTPSAGGPAPRERQPAARAAARARTPRAGATALRRDRLPARPERGRDRAGDRRRPQAPAPAARAHRGSTNPPVRVQPRTAAAVGSPRRRAHGGQARGDSRSSRGVRGLPVRIPRPAGGSAALPGVHPGRADCGAARPDRARARRDRLLGPASRPALAEAARRRGRSSGGARTRGHRGCVPVRGERADPARRRARRSSAHADSCGAVRHAAGRRTPGTPPLGPRRQEAGEPGREQDLWLHPPYAGEPGERRHHNRVDVNASEHPTEGTGDDDSLVRKRQGTLGRALRRFPAAPVLASRAAFVFADPAAVPITAPGLAAPTFSSAGFSPAPVFPASAVAAAPTPAAEAAAASASATSATATPPPPPPPRQPSTLSLSCSLTQTGVTDSGTLSPAIAGASISIVYTPASGSAVTHTQSTDGSGGYSDGFAPTIPGVWHVQAHWGGDETHLPSDSSVCTLTVGRA